FAQVLRLIAHGRVRHEVAIDLLQLALDLLAPVRLAIREDLADDGGIAGGEAGPGRGLAPLALERLPARARRILQLVVELAQGGSPRAVPLPKRIRGRPEDV